MQNNVIPTYSDVMKLFTIVEYSSDKRHYKDIVHNTSEIVATKTEEAWHKANIPIVEHRKILAQIKAYHKSYCNTLKPDKSRKDVASF